MQIMLYLVVGIVGAGMVIAYASAIFWNRLKRPRLVSFFSACLSLFGIATLCVIQDTSIVEVSLCVAMLCCYFYTLWKMLGERQDMGLDNTKLTKYLYLSAFVPVMMLVLPYLAIGQQPWMDKASMIVAVFSLGSLIFAIVLSCKEEKQ